MDDKPSLFSRNQLFTTGEDDEEQLHSPKARKTDVFESVDGQPEQLDFTDEGDVEHHGNDEVQTLGNREHQRLSM